jgi:hypothetical protein
MKNISEYEATLNQYVKDKGLTDEQSTEIHSGIMTLADNLLMGVIPVELIDLVYKGLNYEKDVQEVAGGRTTKLICVLRPTLPFRRKALNISRYSVAR